MSRADQDAFIANAVEQIGKGVKSSLGGTPLPPQADSAAPPTETLPQFDALGNPTGASVEAPIAPQMPYGEQMANVARGTGDVSRVIANGALFGFPDKAVAALRTASGDAPNYPTAIAEERAATDAVGSGVPGLNTTLKGAGSALGGVGDCCDPVYRLADALLTPERP
jgi:hypothetical protein